MNKEALFHQANSVWSYIENISAVTLLFRASVKDTLLIETVEYNRFYDYNDRVYHPMGLYLQDELFNYYIANFIPNHFGCVYYFRITEKKEQYFYNEYGLSKEEPIRLGNYEIPRIQETDVFNAPDFVDKAIFYQIFPDRFNRVGPVDSHFEKWGNEPTFYNKFGGNFKGVIAKLDYLKNLGINAIYFTPITLSHSSHRYDTIDYMKLDPILGKSEDFFELVQKCHEHGIKVIVDAVFNHSSNEFFAFQDVLAYQKRSKYKDWFLIDQFPVVVGPDKTYQTFGHEPHMPKLNSQNPEVREYFLKVARYYMLQFKVDGFRLDVADEVDSDFWRMFRKQVKTLNKDALIIGEVWHNADYYLRGDQFDSVQNYQFYEVVNRFFVYQKSTLNTFKNEITHLLMMYPRNVQRALLNQVDSHDTPRILTLLDGDIKRLRCAIIFQFTYIGMPCIYYGDEVGLVGDKDPDNRRCYIWDEVFIKKDIFEFYQAIIQLRNKETLLQKGDFRFVHIHEDVLAYERYINEDYVQVHMNLSDMEIVNDDTKEDVLLPNEIKVIKVEGKIQTTLLEWR
jgi:glycosidase